MSATSANALKAKIESGGLGVPVFRDVVGENTPLPYIVITEGISTVREPAFNVYDDPEHHVTETVQVDVYQQWRASVGGRVIEDYSLAEDVAQLLDGATLTTAPYPVSGVRMTNSIRSLDVKSNFVRHILTFTVRRQMKRSA